MYVLDMYINIYLNALAFKQQFFVSSIFNQMPKIIFQYVYLWELRY